MLLIASVLQEEDLEETSSHRGCEDDEVEESMGPEAHLLRCSIHPCMLVFACSFCIEL